MTHITIENLLREREEMKDRIRDLELSIDYALKLLQSNRVDSAVAILKPELEKSGVAHD